MISHLSGTVADTTERYLVISVGGVGYKVFATAETIAKSQKSEVISLWTHLAVRENALDLYGFLNKEELSFFELLITVSGIGPKTALGILNVTTVPSLRKAIISGETAHLTKVSGIGKKMADKIVLELKGKLGVDTEADEMSLRDEIDALEALKALGYKHQEAREALKEVDLKIADTGERIKAALKVLGK
ncbi:MAG: Holliday junction branch migration protein RuvA [Candidatus Paceibacterota bacterium]|jgi:Holliday junction DNA helicase RuvA